MNRTNGIVGGIGGVIGGRSNGVWGEKFGSDEVTVLVPGGGQIDVVVRRGVVATHHRKCRGCGRRGRGRNGAQPEETKRGKPLCEILGNNERTVFLSPPSTIDPPFMCNYETTPMIYTGYSLLKPLASIIASISCVYAASSPKP